MTDATELDEAAIRARVEAATEGPWEHSLVGIDPIDDEYVVQTEAVADVICRLDRSSEFIEHPMASARADAEFIAHARTDLPAALDEITRLRAALDEARIRANDWMGAAATREDALRAAEQERDEARADAATANDALGIAPEVLRLAEMSDQIGAWKARAEAAESALAAVRALADRIEREGVTCECGHYVGDAHNSLGCYAVVTYSPLVRCDCTKTDNQDEDAIVANAIRAAALATPTTTERNE